MNTQPPSTTPPKRSKNPLHNKDERKRNFQEASNIKPKINDQPNKTAVTQSSSSSSFTQPAAAITPVKSFSRDAWNEIVQFVITFHAGIDLFLALAPKLSKSLSTDSKKHLEQIEKSFKDFNKTTSMLLNLFLIKDNHAPNESQFESLIDDLSKLTKVFDSIKSLSSAAIKLLSITNDTFMAECQEKFSTSLESFFASENPERTKLEATYDASRFAFKQTAYTFISNVAAPARLMQYFNRLEMPFASLLKSTIGYSEDTISLLTEIHERIKTGLGGMNESGYAKFSRQPTASMRRAPVQDESKELKKPEAKILDLNTVLFLGIAYSFHIFAYHKRVETKFDIELAKHFDALLTSTIRIFVTNEKGAIDALRIALESLQRKLLICPPTTSDFISPYKELVQSCINLLNPNVDEHLKALNSLCRNLNLKDQEKLTDSAQANAYSFHAIIKWVADEVMASAAYKKSNQTLSPVKGITDFFAALSPSAINSKPRLISESLRFKSYAEILKKLLTTNQAQLNGQLANMKGFFKPSISYLLILLFAEISQCCGMNLSYMNIESINSLKTLLEIIGFKNNEQYISTHAAIMDAYQKSYPSHPVYNEAEKKPALAATETKDVKALCVLNIMHIVSTYQTNSSTEAVAKIISIAIQWYFLYKRSIEQPGNLSDADKLFLQLKSAVKELPSDHSWLMPTLENLTNETLVPAGTQVPENLLLQKVAHQDALHYVYKCTIRQYAVFYINYLHAVNTELSKKHTAATAKQRFADRICEKLESLFRLSLKELKKKINEVSDGYPKSIIGLLQSITADWEASFGFNADQVVSIKTGGELSKITEESNKFLADLSAVISPTQFTSATQSTSSTIHAALPFTYTK